MSNQLPLFYHRKAWADEAGRSWAGIGKRLGLSSSRVCVIMKTGRCPRAYIDILRDEFGMPEELLPEPSREKPGPLPQDAASGAAHP
ncbi:MAG: XRE family transcriptional regulator [Desulfovibrio sp.]